MAAGSALDIVREIDVDVVDAHVKRHRRAARHVRQAEAGRDAVMMPTRRPEHSAESASFALMYLECKGVVGPEQRVNQTLRVRAAVMVDECHRSVGPRSGPNRLDHDEEADRGHDRQRDKRATPAKLRYFERGARQEHPRHAS